MQCAVACAEPSKGVSVGNFGATEILIIVVIVVLLFGSTRLPGIARGTGRHLRKTKDSVGTFKEEFESGMREIDPVTPLKETMRDPDPRKASAPKDTTTD
jgi:sec-independent protein translocase protein TatA